jgi:hypothetical protein
MDSNSTEREQAVAMLRTAISQSGMSARRFAMEVLIRDERTVRRWLKAEQPIPKPVMVFLNKWLAEHGEPHT